MTATITTAEPLVPPGTRSTDRCADDRETGAHPTAEATGLNQHALSEPDLGVCDGCGRTRPIVAGILLLETGDQETEDLGFCDKACMAVYVRTRWMETR